MGVPKRRVSHARQGERRSHLAIEPAEPRGVLALPRDEAPHHVCPNCGYYNGRLAVELKPRPAATTPRADAVTAATDSPGGPRGRSPASASPSTRWAATTGRARSSRAPSITRGAHPDDQVILVGDEPTIRAIAGRAAGQRLDRPRHPGHRHGRASGAGPAREEGLLDPRRHGPRQARRGRRGRHRRPHRRRDGRRRPAARAPARRGPPGPGRPDGHRRRAAGPPRHRRQPGLDRRRTSPSTPGWARSSPSACSASPAPRVALLSIGEEKGKGDARIQRATELLDASGLRFVGNVEGKDLAHNLADVVVCDAVLGNVVDQVLRGPLDASSSTCWRREFRGSLAGPAGLPPACVPGSAGSGTSSTTSRSAARRCSASAGRSSSPTVGRSGG